MVSLSERVSRIDSFHTEWRDGSGAEAQTRDTPWGVVLVVVADSDKLARSILQLCKAFC
jgi:hypothetical protein